MDKELEYYFQNKPERVYEIGDRERILKWMASRPRAKTEIKVIGGKDSEVVVVIPTANFERVSRELRKIYSDLTLVFVLSSGPYFNYATSVNHGIQFALKEFHPKWIVVSNDDVLEAENPSKLVEELSTTDRSLVFAKPSSYHTYKVSIIKFNRSYLKVMKNICKIFRIPPAEVYGSLTLKYGEKLRISKLTVIDSMLKAKKFAGEVVKEVVNGGSFMVINRRIVSDKVFDETFINGYEDVFLSLKHEKDTEIIDYQLREKRGMSLGFDKIRFVRLYVNEVYFNYLMEKSEKM
ncbi:hypothetical protein [Sulfolobus acidocaldarius]|uniref:hypothetical protein n=1 Tax=Sulfolobus acidocaldarius TaxID=2285 RepID=UPI000785E74F|nr:hypothetical protein [Sulfolobus acidocaldarius]